jgi:transcriptional regulator with XRE-family HTH domain
MVGTERETLGNRVKDFREKLGMSQQELATRADVALSVITNLEQGLTPDPRVGTILAIADVLRVGVEALTAGLPRRVKKKRPRKPRDG